MNPKRRGNPAPYPIAIRIEAFRMWADEGKSKRLIAATLGLKREQIARLAKRDEWMARYEEMARDARENYDANAAKLLEASQPRMTHQSIKLKNAHAELTDRHLNRLLRDERAGKETDLKKLRVLTAAVRGDALVGSTLLKPLEKKAVGPGPMTFNKGAMCFVGVRPLGRTKLPEPPAELPPAIETDEIITEI